MIMAEPGALRLGAASPELQKIQMGVIEGHRSRCRRAAEPLPMEARCVDERPGIDCLRACSALFNANPRATTEAMLRGALALAGVDVNANINTSTGMRMDSAPVLLLQPAHAIPESLRFWEWPLAFEYNTAAWMRFPFSKIKIVNLELKADSLPSPAGMIAHVYLAPASDFPLRVEMAMYANSRWKRSVNNKCALWQDAFAHIWNGVRATARALPKEALLKMHIWFTGKMNIQYNTAFGDLNAWLSAISAIFPSPFPDKDWVSVRVRTFDDRRGLLVLDHRSFLEELGEWATAVFTKGRQQASHYTSKTKFYYGSIDCTLQFDLPYRLRVAKVLAY
jgi:hypothetical protein